MKKIILSFAVFILIGCSKEEQPNKDIEPTVSVQQQNSLVTNKELTTEEAQQFSKNLLKKINDDEKKILDAFKLKEVAKLESYFYEIQAYIQPDPNDISKSYWIESDLLDPYLKCDTAIRDLQLYALALKNQLREDSLVMKKISHQELEDYQKSKASCSDRVNMTYDQAVKAYEDE
ncbi:hypothetical protein [Acinetobacter bereziniae]|uniref:hypothetical protein n=1 Tax=Acinetobacter bereziniae TaxID=106648 RepID=UPI00300B0D34